MREFGLIGYPLGHSFSKKYFSEKFAREQIPGCSYELFPIPTIDKLPSLLLDHPFLKGLNVTIPYKQQILSYLSSTNIAEGLNACNCICIEGNDLIGYNTDVVGFEKSFISQLQPWHSKALVLGNGGASAAVVFVLKKLGIDYKIVSRQLHQGSHLIYSDVTPGLVETFPVIINTTPLGTYPNTAECPPIPYESLDSEHYLFDLVYNPPETMFLQKGKQKGAAIQNGYDMLVYQAEEAWRIWNE